MHLTMCVWSLRSTVDRFSWRLQLEVQNQAPWAMVTDSILGIVFFSKLDFFIFLSSFVMAGVNYLWNIRSLSLHLCSCFNRRERGLSFAILGLKVSYRGLRLLIDIYSWMYQKWPYQEIAHLSYAFTHLKLIFRMNYKEIWAHEIDLDSNTYHL